MIAKKINKIMILEFNQKHDWCRTPGKYARKYLFGSKIKNYKKEIKKFKIKYKDYEFKTKINGVLITFTKNKKYVVEDYYLDGETLHSYKLEKEGFYWR